MFGPKSGSSFSLDRNRSILTNMAFSDAGIPVGTPLPLDIAVLYADCQAAVPLAMWVSEGWPKRQVRCPACACEVVLKDAW